MNNNVFSLEFEEENLIRTEKPVLVPSEGQRRPSDEGSESDWFAGVK